MVRGLSSADLLPAAALPLSTLSWFDMVYSLATNNLKCRFVFPDRNRMIDTEKYPVGGCTQFRYLSMMTIKAYLLRKNLIPYKMIFASYL